MFNQDYKHVDKPSSEMRGPATSDHLQHDGESAAKWMHCSLHAMQRSCNSVPRAVVRWGRSPTTNFCPSRPCSLYLAHCAKCCSTMDVATVTFSEAVPSPYWGMYTKASHAATCFSLRPFPCKTASDCHTLLQFLPLTWQTL